MCARLVHKADFEQLLGARSWGRSTHFAVHHLPMAPQRPLRPLKKPGTPELSTGPAPACPQLVDDLPTDWWLGCVVPKRHARRAVTRNLLKRQVRACFERLQSGLPQGLWLVRLRQPFALAQFPSARSAALQLAARAELEQVFGRSRA